MAQQPLPKTPSSISPEMASWVLGKVQTVLDDMAQTNIHNGFNPHVKSRWQAELEEIASRLARGLAEARG